ncbi:PAAR domain-containing protein [Herbaspirillum sp.]|uniref:PAAR domain-containing protein n=1 Tax=Herbaspirillum TaxID=963 RepID=UPI002589AA30|nr:PAAR domain-containing protein [Herbaspirillum sp.]MCP3655437.1 PAAR domain-containing protein [Herbaspirillum sp.]MCP3945207.1 PAAR domain-containing protein [Herbaspirillum sp.]MCP4034277.1 PAAR domain-containing protein [Herbaspirillum sp.]MCP4034298.1 PAAR domain-containing protein [Herbaspirillum sp.]
MSILGFIVVGDRTSHGGVVLTGDQTWLIDGAAVARIGDKVSCPRCKRIATIVTSKDPTFVSNGQPAAFDGDITDCGATLYSRHNLHAGLERIPGGNNVREHVENYQPPVMENFRRHFVLHDVVTAQPVAGMSYTINSGTKVVQGETDGQGRTEVVWTAASESVELIAHPKQDLDKDPYHYAELDYKGL